MREKTKYRCNKCRDLTFIIEGDVAIPCECRALREAEEILKSSGISDEFRKKTFESFDYTYDIQVVEAYKKANKYVSRFNDIKNTRNNSIMFLGQVGSGKTHLSLAIANKLMDNCVGVLYMSYREAITKIKQNVMDSEEYERIIGRYKRAKVLLIDDLFKGSITKSDINIMFEIVNFRYFNNLPVIVSCEREVEELLDIDEAVGSRLIEMSKGSISFKLNNIPKKNFKYISDHSMRKTLSYMLQMANGKLENCDDEEIAMKLSEIYMHFWNENMVYEDYEPYSRLDWGGIGYFFIIASMRRFNKLYKKDFDIESVDSQKMMILLSPNGVENLREYIPTKDEDLYKMALEDNIYSPIEDSDFPKLNISEAPLNMTKDGYIFVNPLVMLFNDSMETRFLNYLRKCDNKRYLRIKDKIKERVIPLIIEMIKYKLPNVKYISNFHVRIPLQKKNKRECDLLLIDEDGFVLYLEIKHFYNPQSFCETKKVDCELKKALEKMPDQLSAIRENWKDIKKSYNINIDLKEIQGVIVSHYYLGYDLDIDERTPIVNAPNLYESIAEANSLKKVFLGCKEIDDIYPKIKFIKRELSFDFAKYNFTVEVECLDPRWEILLNKSYKEQVHKSIISDKPKTFNNITDLAKAYLAES